MKTVIILLCAVLIGFGYLLSQDMNTQERNTQLQEQIRQLQTEKQRLQTELNDVKTRLEQTEQAKENLGQQTRNQAETIRRLTLALDDQQERIVALQTKIKLIQAGSPLQGWLSNTLRLGVFLPVIPAALATTYLVVRSRKHSPRKTDTATGPRGTWVQLTERELQGIIRLRRNQHT